MCYNLVYNEYSFVLNLPILPVKNICSINGCSWNDQLVRRRLTNEITMFGGYDQIDVKQLNADQYFMVDLYFNISYIIFFLLMLTYYKYRFEKSKLGKKFHLHLIKKYMNPIMHLYFSRANAHV